MTDTTPRVTPDRIATWANAVTVTRVLLAPLLVVLITGKNGSWPAMGLWFLLCASDGIDGVIARRHGATRSGAFLDPLADKIVVLGAMFILVGEHVFSIIPVLLITARELAISLYRTVAGTQGVTVPARKLAKFKTLVQQLAVGAALWPWTAHRRWLFLSLLWTAVALTLITGADYLLTARRTRREQLGAA